MEKLYTSHKELNYEGMMEYHKYLDKCADVVADVLYAIDKAIKAGSRHEKEMLVLAFQSFPKEIKSFLEEYAGVVTAGDFILYARGCFLLIRSYSRSK
jgi:hypothetical protein